jgi:hypothetical protein
MRCARGHEAAAGTLVRFGVGPVPTCEACCVKFYGIEPPTRGFGFAGGDSVDVKTKQTGGDE